MEAFYIIIGLKNVNFELTNANQTIKVKVVIIRAYKNLDVVYGCKYNVL
ncbi:hypothetical protein QUF55_04705 [Clostridiaceae bacterium HSG29]|nr:hypothetical protein [Clostridiaceae bacterium HSG29]